MTPGLTLLVVGAILLVAGFKNRAVVDTILGLEREQETGRGRDVAGIAGSDLPMIQDNFGPAVAGGQSPKAIIDNVVIPIMRRHGIPVSAASVAAANARHSKFTLTGGVSDHSGPPNVRWAADGSNGKSPTPQMDAAAKELAAAFGIPWDGSGAESVTKNGLRYQMIYRSMVGGNHFNHIHFGIEVQ